MKKIMFACFFLCLITTGKAQVVTIPDANFKAALIAIGVDSNADGQIQNSEAQAAVSVNVRAKNIADMTGIQSFTNLQSLVCDTNALTTLNVSGLSKLTDLDCNSNSISSLVLTGLTSLNNFNCSNNDLTSLDVTSLTNLQVLEADDNLITNLKVTGLLKLIGVSVTNNNLTNIDVRNGIANSIKIGAQGNPSLASICIDSGDTVTGGPFSNLVQPSVGSPAPTGNPAQSFCKSAFPVVANLAVTGENILWYATPTGGTALAPNTAVTNGTHYYASQSVGGACESVARFDVTATVIDPAAPTGNATQSFCKAAFPTVANLTATGTNIKWYGAPTGGAVLGNTVTLTNGQHFYASQTDGAGCESSNRFDVTATVNDPAAPTATRIQTFCNTGTIANLVAVGTDIKWYADSKGGTALDPTTPLVAGTYFASQTVGGCESTARFGILVIINNVPIPAPTAPSPQEFCGGATVANLQATGLALKWYIIPGSVALAPTVPLITHTYYVTQSLGNCESTAAQVQVTVLTPAPTAPSPQVFCGAATVADLQATGSDIKWYIVPGSVALDPTVPLVTRTYYVTETANGCESALTPVEVTVNVTPAPTAPNPQTYCGGAKVANLIATATGTGIKVYLIPGSVALDPTIPLVTHSYLITQTLNNCESAPLEVAVTVNATPPPTAATPQTFCGAATVADLKATGTDIKWYIIPGSVALDPTIPLVTHTYLVTQTLNACESAPIEVAVTVNVTPPPTAASPQTFCGAATVADLKATGTEIKWYIVPGSVALDPSVPLITRNYLVTQTLNGCESAPLTVAVAVNAAPAAPTIGTITQPTCSVGGSVVLTGLPAGNWTITQSIVGGTDATDVHYFGSTSEYTVTGLAAGTYQFEVADITFCSSMKTPEVVINVGAAPNPPVIGAITQPASCSESGSVVLTNLPAGNWTITQNLVGGGEADEVLYYGNTTEYTITGLSAGTYTFQVSDITYCSSVRSAEVVITGGAPKPPTVGTITQPTCIESGSVVLTGLPAGNWTITQSIPGGTDADDVHYYGSTSEYTVTGLSAGTYFFEVSDITYCSSAKTQVVINEPVKPNTPVVGAITQTTCSEAGSVVLTGLPAGNWTITQNLVGGTDADKVLYYGNTSEYTITGLSAGTYLFHVADITYCSSMDTPEVVINPSPCTLGLNKYDIAGLKYYPNPVFDFVTISNTNVITSIELFNLLGQHILSVRPNALTTKMDMSNFPVGSYLLQVQSEGKTSTVKILKR